MTVLDVDLKIQQNRSHPFLRSFERGSVIVANRIVSLWQHNDIIFKLFPSYYKLEEDKNYIKDFVHEIIVSKRKEMKSKAKIAENNNEEENLPKRCKSFLELLIESTGSDKGYTNTELFEEVQILIMAGTDTSAVGVCFTLLLLSRHPEVQEKVYEELKVVFGDSKRLITHEDLPHLKYLEIVMKESLRLYPPVPMIVRHADRDLTLPSGVTIVKDCTLFMSIWAVNRNPRYWGPDAEEFRPERWLEDSTVKHPAQYIPFSYGPRNCAGYQYAMNSMKTVLASMLRRYRILPKTDPSKDGALEPLRLKFDLMMKDVDNFTVRLENRL